MTIFYAADKTTERGPLAHGGSHNRQHPKQQPSPETAPIGVSATPKPEALQPSPVSTAASPVNTQASLIPSIEGLPFGLGELSLGIVLAGPVGLFALRQWLQT